MEHREPTTKLPEIDDDQLIAVEYDLPRVEENLEEQAEAEHERYDDQILAALVTF
jgi:hypothetical protein